jgi:hypothetical protein
MPKNGRDRQSLPVFDDFDQKMKNFPTREVLSPCEVFLPANGVFHAGQSGLRATIWHSRFAVEAA